MSESESPDPMTDEALRVQPVKDEEFSILADWIIELNRSPEWQCLHSWSGQSAAELRDQLRRDWKAGELCYLIALEEGNWVGSIGAEYDLELGRAWIHGPHTIPGTWSRLSGVLYETLLGKIPPGITRWDVFLNMENRRAQRFYAAQGFQQRPKLSFEYCLQSEAHPEPGTELLDPLTEANFESFKELFLDLFPTAYYSPERIRQMDGDSHRVFMIQEADIVQGFVTLSLNPGSTSGEIQFLGVRDECRGMGYGRQLLMTAVNWLIKEEGKSLICLNVDDENDPAIALYETLGFKLLYTGVGLFRLSGDAGDG